MEVDPPTPINDENTPLNKTTGHALRMSIKEESVEVDLSAIEGINANGEGVPHIADHLKRNSEEAIAEAREKLERWVLDEGRPITASYALKRCQLDAGNMQRVLSDFAEQNATTVQVCHWLIGGRLPDDPADEGDGVERTAISVCHQDELERVEHEVFTHITTRRLYSVQPNAVKDMQTIYNVNHLDPMPPYKAVLEGKTSVFYPRAWNNYRRYKSTEADYAKRMQRKQEQHTFDLLKRNEPLAKKERGPKMTLEQHMPQSRQEETATSSDTTSATEAATGTATSTTGAAVPAATSTTGVAMPAATSTTGAAVLAASGLGSKRQPPPVKPGKADAAKRKKLTNEPRSGATLLNYFKKGGE